MIPPPVLDVEDSEFPVFVGLFGCGQITLLHLIAGLQNVTSGPIAIACKTRPMVSITHDQVEVMTMADKIVVLRIP